jgi:DNA-directed RNA polymerase subunit RPC12/RpoP
MCEHIELPNSKKWLSCGNTKRVFGFMRILQNQIFASTAVDKHGDRITRDELREIFDQIPDPYPLYSEHKIGNRPFSKSYNKRFEEIVSGEWAIICDVEVYDESKLQEYSGYSISFTRSTYTTNPDRDPELHIEYNPRLFDTQELRAFADSSSDTQQINVSDLYQKSLDIPLLIIISFISGSVASGFFKAMGADLYASLKKYLIHKGDDFCEKHNDDLICQFNFVVTELPNQPTIIFSISSSMLNRLSDLNISDQTVLHELRKHCDLSEIQSASIVLLDDSPTWKIEYIINMNNVLLPDTIEESETFLFKCVNCSFPFQRSRNQDSICPNCGQEHHVKHMEIENTLLLNQELSATTTDNNGAQKSERIQKADPNYNSSISSDKDKESQIIVERKTPIDGFRDEGLAAESLVNSYNLFHNTRYRVEPKPKEDYEIADRLFISEFDSPNKLPIQIRHLDDNIISNVGKNSVFNGGRTAEDVTYAINHAISKKMQIDQNTKAKSILLLILPSPLGLQIKSAIEYKEFAGGGYREVWVSPFREDCFPLNTLR